MREEMNLAEMRDAVRVGVTRRLGMLEVPDAHGFDHTSWARWGNDIEGAAAEYVYARHTGQKWNALPDPADRLRGDVGHVQVRATEHMHGGLVLHDSDADDAPFVLVVGSMPTFHIVGGIVAAAGKDRKRYWRSDWKRPAYCVPARDLRAVR